MASLIASVSANGTPTTATTAAIDTTGATAIVVNLAPDQGGAITITDSKGNTYTDLTPQINSLRDRLSYVLSPTVGSGHTFTASAGGSNIYACLQVFAFSGVTAYESQNGAVGFTSPQSCGSVTPAGNGALVVVGLCSNSLTSTDVEPTGFTGFVSNPMTAGVNFQGSAAYYIQSTAAAINPAWTWSGGTKNAAAVVAVFTAASTSAAGWLGDGGLGYRGVGGAILGGGLGYRGIGVF